MQRIHSNGGNWVDPKDDTKPAFDQPKAVEALSYEFNAGHKEKIALREGVARTSSPPGPGRPIYQAFSDGTYAMMEEGSWILARMTQTSNIPENVNWDVAPIPPAAPPGASPPGHQQQLEEHLEGLQVHRRGLGVRQVPDGR